jgi:hypothetical protein
MHSPLEGADSSDFLRFRHYHTNPVWFTKEFGGRMITVTQELRWDYLGQVWYYTNTVTFA